MHAQTIRLEGGIGSHGVRFSGVVVGAIAAEWIGFRIERSFAIAFVGIDARRAARGVAADADELAGLPRPAIDLATLKPYNARKLGIGALPGLRYGCWPASASWCWSLVNARTR